MSEEPQEEGREEGTGTPDLGARLVRRAVLPGVSTPGLDRDLAARGGPRTGGLAAEIRRRWLPAGAVGGRGPALPYFGGWPGGAGGPAAGAAGAAGSAGAAGGAAPIARTVATSPTPAAQASEALSGLGAELQQRHSAGMAGGGMVRRKTAPAASTVASAPGAASSLAAQLSGELPIARASAAVQRTAAERPAVQRATAQNTVAQNKLAQNTVTQNTATQNTVPQIPAGAGGGSSPLGGGGLGQGGGQEGGGAAKEAGGSLIHRSPDPGPVAPLRRGTVQRVAIPGTASGPAPQAVGELPVVRARTVQRAPSSAVVSETGGGLLAGMGATSSLTNGPAPLLTHTPPPKGEGPPPVPSSAAGFPAGEISVQPMIRRAPADNLQPAILRRKALPAEPPAVTAAPATGGEGISRQAVMPLASTGVADGTVARTTGTAGTTRAENAPPAAPAAPSFPSAGATGAAPVTLFTEMGPAIRRRSTGAPAPLPLAELRRKALGSEDEGEEPAGTVQRTPATAVAVPAAPSALASPAPLLPLASLASGSPAEATEATIRRAPATPSGQPGAPGAPDGPLPHRASPAPSPSPAIQSLPPGPGLLPPGLAGSAAQLVQRSAAASSSSLPSLSSFAPSGPASPPGMSQVASGIAMPLARVAQPTAGAQSGPTPASPGVGLIQRAEASSGDAGASPSAATPLATATPAATAGPVSGSQTNEDELAERVLRRLMRTLAVEGERRGLRRWP